MAMGARERSPWPPQDDSYTAGQSGSRFPTTRELAVWRMLARFFSAVPAREHTPDEGLRHVSAQDRSGGSRETPWRQPRSA
jgi:hypothetical protein